MKELIEKTKVQNIIQERKRKRGSEEEGNPANNNDNSRLDSKKPNRKFKQTSLLGKLYDDNDYKLKNSVLKSIFSKNAED
jgi:hypothetical protein